MNLNQLRKTIRPLLDSGVSIELVSAPGRGKSEFIADTIKVESKRDGEEWGFATLFLATMTPPDLIGYIFKGEREYDGRTVPVSEPTAPMWMFTDRGNPLSHHKRGILFLDEYGQGEGDVKRASAELMLNRRLGPWSLPPGWSVVAASNRSKDRSGVTKSFDFVINRRCEINITDDLLSLLDWQMNNRVDPAIIAFTESNAPIVLSDGVPEKQGPWCTPRSLMLAYRMLDSMRGGDQTQPLPVDADAQEVTAGVIGDAAAAQLFVHLKLALEMPSVADIIKAPTKTMVPKAPDAQMLVSYTLANYINDENAGPIITYMNRIGKEFGVGFMKIAIRRDPSLINNDAVDKWVDGNATLMTAING